MEDGEKKPLLLNKKYTLNKYNGSVMDNGYTGSGLNIHRPVYQIEDLNRDTLYEKPYTPLKQKVKRTVKSVRLRTCLLNTIPVLKWLPSYEWKKHFIGDVISGITVSIMHIPQGMAYGLLGGVPPVIGMYMAFFPVMAYFLFGTSRHVSIGTFAVVCLMTGKIVQEYSTVAILQNGTTVPTQMGLEYPDSPEYTNVKVAITVSFVVALMQIAMYLLRMGGIVSILLSDTLVNGFTCASAFHVASSQLKDLLGLPTKKRRGNFGFIFIIYDSILAIPAANVYAIGTSAVFCTILILNNELLKPWLAKKTRIPFPIELVAVLVGTAFSYGLNAYNNYGISIVGRIPTGFPTLDVPAFSLIPDIFVDSFVICMVSYTITMSMALIFARKLMYEVGSNQELLALGISNLVGSFTSSMPVTASLSRSVIQEAVGGVTQLASIVSCLILMVVLLWIGPIFETLPRCVLASIILVALKGMLLQIRSIRRFWKLSKWDALVWLVTFSTTLFVQISYGLAAGLVVSLLSIFIQGYRPYTCLLGVVPSTDLYLDLKRYKGVQEIEGIKIFHYSGGLSFASRATFKKSLIKKVGFDAASILRKRIKLEEHSTAASNTNSTSVVEDLLIKCVILDLSGLTFIDPSGVEQLRLLQSEYLKLDIEMYIAACSGPVYEMFIKCDRLEKVESQFSIFPTVHDAVLYARSSVIKNKKT